MKNLFFNKSCIKYPLTGIGQYALNLIGELIKFPEISLSLPSKNTRENAFNLISGRNFFQEKFPFLYDVRHFYHSCKFNFKKFDIYHEPANILLNSDCAAVLTVHDLSWIRYPETHPAGRVRFMNKHFESGLRRADRIITPSYFVKKELIDVFGVSPEIIHPIHLGGLSGFEKKEHLYTINILKKYNLTNHSYWLIHGALEPRKNINLVLDAFLSFPKIIRINCPLVVVGSNGWRSSKLVRRLQSLTNLGEVRYLGYIYKNDLFCIISGAKALIYPSFYEGFGLPALESISCGTPVIASNCASLPEVLGNAGIFIDPYDVDVLIEKMKNLLDDQEYLKKMQRLSFERSCHFSWAECARSTLGVYELALK